MPWYLPVQCPILWEELRRRIRGGRGQIVLLAYGVALVLVLIGTALGTQVSSDPRQWPEFGKQLWTASLIGQLVLVLLISPAITAGAICTERERGSLDLLFLTRMSSVSLVVGKYLGAIGQLLLVILSGLPVVSVVFMFGGVSPGEVVAGYALLLATGIFYTTLGLLASCLFKRMVSAIAWAYGFTLLVLLGLPGAYLLLLLANIFEAPGDWVWMCMANPVLLLLDPKNSVSPLAIFSGAAAMLIEGIVIVGVCAMLVMQLRNATTLFSGAVSLEVAQHNSRKRPR